MIKNRPFLKWAGSKYRCLDRIIPHLPPGKRYLEPFVGSGAVFLNIQYPQTVLAESNRDLVHVLQYLQREGELFIHDCKALFTQENNTAEQYYAIRLAFNECTDARQRAIYFVYLNRHGYNGLCRYNQKGIYNVPFGRYLEVRFPHDDMLLFYQKSQTAHIAHQDFQDTFAMAQAGDVMYCDPPYVPLQQTSNFSAYTHDRFDEAAHINLARCAEEAAQRGVIVLVSNHDTAFTRHHYQKAKLHAFPVQRMISCKADKRLIAHELLAVF